VELDIPDVLTPGIPIRLALEERVLAVTPIGLFEGNTLL
jgi:hypothetical protein